MKSRKSKITDSILFLLGNAKLPVTAAEILKVVKANKTTIYRDLYKLVSENKVIELDFGNRVKLYEIANLGHHHHLVCTSCNSVLEIKISDELASEESRLKLQTGFNNIKHSLEFFGICPKCA